MSSQVNETIEKTRRWISDTACVEIEGHSRTAFTALIALALGAYILNILLVGGLATLINRERRQQNVSKTATERK